MFMFMYFLFCTHFNLHKDVYLDKMFIIIKKPIYNEGLNHADQE